MHAHSGSTLATILALLAASCSGGSPHAQNAQAKVEIRNEISDILEKVTDRPSAQRAIEQVKGLVPRWKQAADESRALGESGPLDSKLEMRIRASRERLAQSRLKVSGYPGELDELTSVMSGAGIQ